MNERPLTMSLMIDRFEDELAVLVDASHTSHFVARSLLPDGAREGQRLVLTTQIVADETDVGALRRALVSDDGGDIKL